MRTMSWPRVVQTLALFLTICCAGRVVRTIADERIPAARHRRIWDRRDNAGNRLAGGIYLPAHDRLAGPAHAEAGAPAMRTRTARARGSAPGGSLAPASRPANAVFRSGDTPALSLLHLQAETYVEPMTLSKRILISAGGGAVRIGGGSREEGKRMLRYLPLALLSLTVLISTPPARAEEEEPDRNISSKIDRDHGAEREHGGAEEIEREREHDFEAGEPEHAFDEDEDHIRAFWESAMTPEEYQNALVKTGMAASRLDGGAPPILSGSWTSMGPVGGIMNDSGQSIHSFNGRISCIGTMDTGGGNFDILVGGCSGGLWRNHSADGQGIWTSIGDNLPNQSVRAFSVNQNNQNDIVVGSGDAGRFGGAGMFRTLNGGATWLQVTLPVSPMTFGRIERSPGDPNLLLAACSSGLLRSTDGGNTWILKLSGNVNDLCVDPTNFNVQYCTQDNAGLMKSTNAGSNWTNLNVPLPQGVPFTRGFVTVCPGSPGNVGLFLCQSMFQVLRSTNAGAAWTNITGTLGTPGNGQWHMAEFFHTGAIQFRPNNPDEIFVAARGPQATTDGGASWHDVMATHADVTQLRFFDATGPDFLWVCCDGGVLGTVVGGSAQNWNGNSSTGLSCMQIDFMDSERNLRAIGIQDNGVDYSTNGGSVWKYSTGGDGLDCEIVDDLANEFWNSSSLWPPPGIRVYRQRGTSLTFTNNTAESMDGLFYNKYVNWMFSVGDDDVIYGADCGASPLHWVVDGSVPSQYHVRGTPTGSYVDGRTLYMNVSQTGGGVIPTVLIARTGESWVTSAYDFGGTGGVQNIYASTENAGEAWVTMSRSFTFEPLVYHTKDFGATWTDVTGNLSELKIVRCLVQKPFEPQILWIGTDIGVFKTTDGGTTWTPDQAGMPIVPCTDLRYLVDPSHTGQDILMASTYGRGTYQQVVLSFGVVYVDPNAPRTTEDGTYNFPYNTYAEGRSHLPTGASLALYGNYYSVGHVTYSTPMTLRAYGGTATLGQ